MIKGRRSTARLLHITLLLVAAVCVLLVLSSMIEKNGGEAWLSELANPSGHAQPVSSDGQDTLEVHFIDVGQGESILIIAPEKVVLIDAGENDKGDVILQYLKKYGIESIDIAIGTHPHSDHIGGMDYVINKTPVETVILPVIPDELVPTTVTYTDLLLAIDSAGLSITPAVPGDVYDLGGGAKLTILGPLRDYNDLNNMSIITRVSFGKTSFLLTGDAEKKVEADLLDAYNLTSTVLCVGHHGSSTSSSKEFLQRVSPQVAAISCGLDNSYGHPHREVMQRLEAMSVRILRTDLNGSIRLISDGESVGIEVEKGN